MSKKMIQNMILIIFLLFGVLAPVLSQSTKAHATNISVIEEGVDVEVVEGGGLTISGADSNVSNGFKAFLGFIKLLSGGGTLVMLMVFIINFVKLGAAGTNAKARAEAISALIWSGIATACLSMVTVIFFFFFKMKDNVDVTLSESRQII